MMLLMINMIMSFIFLFLKHPMTMGLTLLMQTVVIALITGLFHSNFWFSYILFLIMIGGLLVLFIYMTSIASNEMFSYSNNIFMMILGMTLILMLNYLLFDNMYINFSFKFLDSENLLISTPQNIMLMKYFNYPSIFMIFFMVIYLFITLIAVVKITKIESGPLRQKF